MFYNYKDINIYYQEIGSGKPILILHGLSCNLELMKGCIEPIFKDNKEFKRIYVDLPGMGKSDANLNYASSDKILQILLSFFNDIVKENFLLIGESYGGYLARGILAYLSTYIEGMMLLCPLIIPDSNKRNLPKNIFTYQDNDFLSTLSQNERKEFSEYAVIANQMTYQRYINEIYSGIKVANQLFINHLEKYYSFSTDVDSVIHNLHYDKPVLFICGKQDNCVGYKDLWKLYDDYSRATFSILDLAGHNLQIEQPRLFNELVINWLERIKMY